MAESKLLPCLTLLMIVFKSTQGWVVRPVWKNVNPDKPTETSDFSKSMVKFQEVENKLKELYLDIREGRVGMLEHQLRNKDAQLEDLKHKVANLEIKLRNQTEEGPLDKLDETEKMAIQNILSEIFDNDGKTSWDKVVTVGNMMQLEPKDELYVYVFKRTLFQLIHASDPIAILGFIKYAMLEIGPKMAAEYMVVFLKQGFKEMPNDEALFSYLNYISGNSLDQLLSPYYKVIYQWLVDQNFASDPKILPDYDVCIKDYQSGMYILRLGEIVIVSADNVTDGGKVWRFEPQGNQTYKIRNVRYNSYLHAEDGLVRRKILQTYEIDEGTIWRVENFDYTTERFDLMGPKQYGTKFEQLIISNGELMNTISMNQNSKWMLEICND